MSKLTRTFLGVFVVSLFAFSAILSYADNQNQSDATANSVYAAQTGGAQELYVGEKAAFPCGDVNGDGNVDILDIIYLIDFKFKQGPDLICPECNCSDGIDNDGDGFTDCEDLDCQGTPACPETNCADGIDNDGDGFTDCDDLDCAQDPACGETICNDGVDNDGDGFTDCEDNDCIGDPNCPETNCADGIDNDGDGFTDCADFDCANDPNCQ